MFALCPRSVLPPAIQLGPGIQPPASCVMDGRSVIVRSLPVIPLASSGSLVARRCSDADVGPSMAAIGAVTRLGVVADLALPIADIPGCWVLYAV